MAQEDLSAVLEQLASADPYERFQAVAQLCRTPDAPTDTELALVPLLQDPHPEIRVAVARAAKDRFLSETETVDALKPLVQDDKRAVRLAAVQALGNAGRTLGLRGADALTFAASDEDLRVRESAERGRAVLGLSEKPAPARPPRRTPRLRPRFDVIVWRAGEVCEPPSTAVDLDGYFQELLNGVAWPAGGLRLQADGAATHPDWCADSFSYARGWYFGARTLLLERAQAWAFAWEESNISMWPIEDEIVLDAVHSSGRVVVPRVTFLLDDFVRALLEVAASYVALVGAIRDRLDAEGHAKGWRPLSERSDIDPDDEPEAFEKLDAIDDGFPEDLQDAVAALRAACEGLEVGGP